MFDVLWSIGGFIVAIGVLVAFHELGHYWVARRCGVKVLRYSLGFGKPLWARRAADGVEWVIAAIPLGGYVRMLDEREGPVAPAERALAFNNASLPRRAAIVAAGPAFNFILAVAFYWLVFVLGVEGLRPVLGAPPPDSAAARAGLVAGEEILRVGATPVDTWSTLRTELIERSLAGGAMPLAVRGRDGAERQVTIALEGVRVDPELLFDDLGLREPDLPARLAEVLDGDPAAAAGFRAGDLLLARDGVPIASWADWARWLRTHPGAVVAVEVERDGRRQTLRVVVGERDGTGYFGARVDPARELWQDLRAETRLGPVAAVPAALEQTWRMSVLTLKLLGRMVIGDVSVKNVSGPIQIAQVAGISAQIGLPWFLSFLAIVSLSLGVLNLLPVPLLDGGHLLYFGIEAIKGRPLSERAQEAGQRIGLTFLVLLMGLAFYNDITRLLG